METWHRVAFNGDTKSTFLHRVKELGIKYKVSPLPHHKTGLISFDITETDPNWPVINVLIEQFGASNIYNTIFSEEEILSAPWSRLIPVFEQGYPLPKEAWLSGMPPYGERCSKCGIPKKQQQFRFRIKKEPRLGKKSFMSLYWTYALFAVPIVFEAFTENELTGYEKWPILVHKTAQLAQSMAQVYVPQMAEASLIPEETLKRNLCPECGTVKYFPHMRGYMQFTAELLVADVDFMLSQEWFGDGHAAYREILVSNKVARLILERKWLGVQLKPIKLISAQRDDL